MSYRVLYRKYRPNFFRDVIGQDCIITTLKNSILSGNFSHAYVFTGPRGTGKTSTAKILARAINCENPEDGEPCGECNACQNFVTTPDIIEIDAASNNGVDEIRELRNNITLAPTSSKYKVYIIDEVHMLSTGAFNALLKTLEEPPSHAIFILATTEVYKVPITILSRCQRFDFKKISKKIMVDYLEKICSEENILYDNEALEEIYYLSDGCLRDALSILDQLSKNTKKVDLDAILDNYNIVSNKMIEELLVDLKNANTQRIIDALNTLEESGMNAQRLLKKVINYLEGVIINIKLKKESRFNSDTISKLINLLNQCYVEARINENTFTMIKLAFLEVIPCAPTPETKKSQELSQNNVKADRDIIDIRINNCFVDANRRALTEITDLWINMEKKKLHDIDLQEYTPVAASSLYIIFKSEDSSLVELFNMKTESIEKMLKKNNVSKKVIAVTEERWSNEKEKYKKNLQKGTVYEYIDEPVNKKGKSKIEGELVDIFQDKPVEIA